MPAMTLQTLTPIIVVTILAFFTKGSKNIALLGVGLLSYFYPAQFLVLGFMVGIIYLSWKFQK